MFGGFVYFSYICTIIKIHYDMTTIFILIAIVLFVKFSKVIFEFIIGMFIAQLIWQVVKFFFKVSIVVFLAGMVLKFIF
jgi:hypothetical protein